MSAPTITAPQAAPTAFTFEDLEALATGMSVRVEHHDLNEDDNGDYRRSVRTIRLSTRLEPRQRLCTLAVLVAHARLGDINLNGHSDAEARSMAFQMLIPAPERAAVIRAWRESRDDDPHWMVRDHGVTPRMAAAYSDLHDAWHPAGCIGWDGLCGNGDEDDIHAFTPAHQEASDAQVLVCHTIIGTPSGTEPLESSLGIDLDLPIIRDQIGTFHVTPEQARELAGFLIAQAAAAEAWDEANLPHLNGERSAPSEAGDGDG